MEHAGSKLIQQIQDRDQQALGLLYDRFAPMVNAVIFRILADPAETEEVLGETFWQVWQRAKSYDPARGALAGWLVTIARSLALDRLRARRKREANTLAVGVTDRALARPAPPVPEAVALQGEQARAVVAALAALSEEQRLPLELAYYKGLSQTEIAQHLAQPVGTIKTRMRLGILRLRKMLEPFMGETP